MPKGKVERNERKKGKEHENSREQEKSLMRKACRSDDYLSLCIVELLESVRTHELKEKEKIVYEEENKSV